MDYGYGWEEPMWEEQSWDEPAMEEEAAPAEEEEADDMGVSTTWTVPSWKVKEEDTAHLPDEPMSWASEALQKLMKGIPPSADEMPEQDTKSVNYLDNIIDKVLGTTEVYVREGSEDPAVAVEAEEAPAMEEAVEEAPKMISDW